VARYSWSYRKEKNISRDPRGPEEVSKPGSCCGSVLVDEATKEVVALELGVGRWNGCVSWFGREER
jgi:hypothetical protein